MDFKEFLNLIPKITKVTLPATEAHLLMAPPERVQLMRDLDISQFSPRKAAVMILLYPRNQKTNLALILRNEYKGVHSSQIAFPGGKVELSDESVQAAALRETHEEIGIEPDQIQIVRAFTEIFIPPSNFMVHPFLGYSDEELIFKPDPSEVAGMIEFPLQHFLESDTVINAMMATSYSKNISVPAFKINDHLVWGATAMIMSELSEVLKKVL